MDTITFDGMKYHVLAYLDDIAGRIREIDHCEEGIADANRRLNVQGVKYSDAPSAPGADGSALPDGIAALIEARERHAATIAVNEDEIQRAWLLCNPRVSENRHVLWLYYIQGMPWKRVARAINKSERQVYRMQVDGITELYSAMPERWRNIYDAI